jgi:hypothetical protein
MISMQQLCLKDVRTSFPTDMMLLVGDNECVFNVHKLILFAKIPYFRTLFSFETASSKGSNNSINIPDISAPIMATILDWVYAAEIGSNFDWNRDGWALLQAADKLSIIDLVGHSCNILKGLINRENACAIAELAVALNLTTILDIALGVIHKEYELIRDTESYNLLTDQTRQKLLDYIHRYKPVRQCRNFTKGMCRHSSQCKFKHA